MKTDKEILDWMQREGLESVVRCPQFNHDGSAMGICLWGSHWTPGRYFVSLRGAAMAGMEESANPVARTRASSESPAEAPKP